MLKVEFLDTVEGPCVFCGTLPEETSIRISKGHDDDQATAICSEDCMDLFVKLSDNDKIPVDWMGSHYESFINQDNKVELGSIKDD